MLIGFRIFLNRRNMQSTLVGKGSISNISGMAIGRTVEQFIKQTRHTCQLPQLFYSDARLVGPVLFEHQIGDQRNQIGITTAFAKPIKRTLHMAHTGFNGL